MCSSDLAWRDSRARRRIGLRQNYGGVLALTVMTVNHDLPRGAVQIIARRNLLDGDVTWLASASGGASLEDPGTAAFVVAETDRLRSEYGL